MIYISTADISGSYITDRIEALASVGVHHIELSGGSAYYPHEQLLSDLLRLKEKYSLEYLLHNYFPPPAEDFVFNLASNNPKIIEQSFAHAKKALSFSKQLGAKKIAFHSGFLVDAETSELNKLLTKRPAQLKELASGVFLSNIRTLESFANGITMYFENNIITQANLGVYEGSNPFLLCSYEDYKSLQTLQPFRVLLDVAHLKVSAKTLGIIFESELDSFLAETDYIHFSQNDSVDDLNMMFDETDSVWQKISTKPDKTITLEIKGELDTIGQLYLTLRRSHEK